MELFFILSRNKIKFLFFYFSTLLIIGITLSALSLNYEIFLRDQTITIISLIGGVGTALMGATIYYMRKLYKCSIKSIFSNPKDDNGKIREMGLFAYYLLRPVFSIIFSIIFHIALKASVSIVTVKETNLDTGMIFLTMIFSFFIGFSAGDIIDKLEFYSKEFIDKAIRSSK